MKTIGSNRITFVVCGLLLVGALPVCAADNAKSDYDIVIYGDSSCAVTAAVAAKRLGRSVILVNPTRFLGGMSAIGIDKSNLQC